MARDRTEPAVIVYERKGQWAWRYEDESITLEGNDVYSSPAAAIDAATIAYPDVEGVAVVGPEVTGHDGSATEPSRRGRRRRRRPWMIILLLAIAVIYFWLTRDA